MARTSGFCYTNHKYILYIWKLELQWTFWYITTIYYILASTRKTKFFMFKIIDDSGGSLTLTWGSIYPGYIHCPWGWSEIYEIIPRLTWKVEILPAMSGIYNQPIIQKAKLKTETTSGSKYSAWKLWNSQLKIYK